MRGVAGGRFLSLFLALGSFTCVPNPSPSVLPTGKPIRFPVGLPGGGTRWSPPVGNLFSGRFVPMFALGGSRRWNLGGSSVVGGRTGCARRATSGLVCAVRSNPTLGVREAVVAHGKSCPVGSARSCSWPSRQTTAPSPSRRMSAGIDVTPNSAIKAAPRGPLASACGIAVQGIAEK